LRDEVDEHVEGAQARDLAAIAQELLEMGK